MGGPNIVGLVIWNAAIFLPISGLGSYWVFSTFEMPKTEAAETKRAKHIVILALVATVFMNIWLLSSNAKYENAPEWQKRQWEENREEDNQKYGPDPSYGGTTHLN